jgi:predicted acylesterase/phospholipase RssA
MTVFVFSGSGILFPAHLGFLRFLYNFLPKREQRNMTFVGTSGGSMVASLMATGMSPEEMKDIAKSLLPKKAISLNWKLWQPARHIGLFELDKMESELRKYLPKIFFDYKQHTAVVVTADLESKETVYFSKEMTPATDVARVVRASCSVPFLFTPVEFGFKLLTDGGITNNFAIDYFGSNCEHNVYGSRLLPRLGSTKTRGTLKDLLDKSTERHNNKINRRLDFILSVFDCMMTANLREHLEDAVYAKTANIEVPYEPFDFSISEEDIEIMFKTGYEQAEIAFTKRGK